MIPYVRYDTSSLISNMNAFRLLKTTLSIPKLPLGFVTFNLKLSSRHRFFPLFMFHLTKSDSGKPRRFGKVASLPWRMNRCLPRASSPPRGGDNHIRRRRFLYLHRLLLRLGPRAPACDALLLPGSADLHAARRQIMSAGCFCYRPWQRRSSQHGAFVFPSPLQRRPSSMRRLSKTIAFAASGRRS